MTIVAPDSPAPLDLLANAPDVSLRQAVANEPRSIDLANHPSPFELLFSQRINSSGSANLVNQDQQTSEIRNSAEFGQLILEQVSSSPINSIGVASLVNPLAIPVGTRLFATTSNQEATTGSEVVHKVSSASMSNEGGLKASATSSRAWLRLASALSSDLPPESDSSSTSQRATAGNINGGTDASRLFHEILSVIGQTITSNSGDVDATSGTQKLEEAAEAFAAQPITIYSISISGLESSFDGPIAENHAAIVDSANVALPAQHPASHVNSAITADGTVISQLNLAGGTEGESAFPVTEKLATAVEEQLEQEPGTGPVTIRIQMDRPDLGPVNLHVTILNDVVSIRVITHDQLTRHLIDSQIEDLRQSLNDRGINCDKIQIDCDSTGQQFSDRKKPAQAMTAMGLPASRWGRARMAESATGRQDSRLNFVA